MSRNLAQSGPVAHVAEVVHHGEQLIIPEGMELEAAVDLIKRRMQYMQEEVKIDETFDVFPWDGAHGLNVILERKYGWSPAVPTPGFFGSNPPQMLSIEVGFQQVTQVPWGRFALPNVNGYIQTSTGAKDGRVAFRIGAVVKRDSEATVRELINDLRAYLANHSIYRGKAIKVRFLDEDGEKLPMPEPKFLDVGDVDTSLMVYPVHTQDAIETNLFTPIRRIDDCILNDIPVKRGVLLGGMYGTGKTLAAFGAAKLAEQANVTFIYVPRTDELAEALEFIKPYSNNGAVVFCEDIDRVVTGDRSIEIDDILNIIDGIDTKRSKVITVLTTNHLNNINPAMLRPGRLDAVIEVMPPDAAAAERLLRVYGGRAIAPDADLTEASAELAGVIPATIAEVVKRAKLAQLRRTPAGQKIDQLSPEALREAARTMKSQTELMHKLMAPKPSEPTIDNRLRKLIDDVVNGEGSVLSTEVSVASMPVAAAVPSAG
jgi:transitional endoplasmic reticulum ATPase